MNKNNKNYEIPKIIRTKTIRRKSLERISVNKNFLYLSLSEMIMKNTSV